MGEIYGRDASVLKDDSLDPSKELSLVASYLDEAPFEEFGGDIVMGSDAPNIGHIKPICTEPRDLIPTSSHLIPITPSRDHGFHESSDDVKGYYSSLDPYSVYLKDVPRKIMWCPFFDNGFDFSMALDKFRKPLTFFASSFVVFSFLHNFKKHGVTFGKLLGAFTTSKSRTRLLSDVAESRMLLEPPIPPS